MEELASALGIDRAAAAEALEDASRSIASLDESESDYLAAEVASPEDSLVTDERSRMVRAAVGALPEKMRHIVEEIYFKERSVGEVAEELGLTHSAVSQQRSEAMRLIRDGLQTHYADEGMPAAAPESRIAPARRTAYLARVAHYASVAVAGQTAEIMRLESRAS